MALDRTLLAKFWVRYGSTPEAAMVEKEAELYFTLGAVQFIKDDVVLLQIAKEDLKEIVEELEREDSRRHF